MLMLFPAENAMKEVGDRMTLVPSSKVECAQKIVQGGVLRHRQVIFPYWSLKIALLLRDWMPDLLDQLAGKSYTVENIS